MTRTFQNYCFNLYELKLFSFRSIKNVDYLRHLEKFIYSPLFVTSYFFYSIINNLFLEYISKFINYRSKLVSNKHIFFLSQLLLDSSKQSFYNFILHCEFESKFETNFFGLQMGRTYLDAVYYVKSHLVFNTL